MNRGQFSQPEHIEGMTAISGKPVLEFTASRQFDSPTAVVEEYYQRAANAIEQRRELTHSTMVDETIITEVSSIEATVVEEGLDADALRDTTHLDEQTVETVLAGGEAALVESTVEYTESGESQSDTETWAVATEDGVWRLVERGSEVETGTESTEQVAENLNILTTVGIVDSDNTISELRLGVQPAYGSDAINLAELTLQYVSDNAFANIVVGDDGDQQAAGDSHPDDIEVTDSDTTQYTIDVITAAQSDDVVMTDDADRYVLVIPLADERQQELSPLEEGDSVEMTITTEVGAQTVVLAEVPESLDEYSEGEAVTL
jgi:flagellin FlaB